MSMTRRNLIFAGGALALLAVLLAVAPAVKKTRWFHILSGHDTPIVIAGGSIHAHCIKTNGCNASWKEADQDSTSYRVTIDSRIRHLIVSENTAADESGGSTEKEIQRFNLLNAYDSWSIEISQTDGSVSANGSTTLKAITISPDLLTDSNGTTLKISITAKPNASAGWQVNSPSEIRFRGNPHGCTADGTDTSDPLGHCDILSTVTVTILGDVGKPITCKTTELVGKCKIKFKV